MRDMISICKWAWKEDKNKAMRNFIIVVNVFSLSILLLTFIK